MSEAVSRELTQSAPARPMTNSADRPAGRLPTKRPRSESTALPARDRRAGVERTIELSRWMVLIFAAVANNFPGLASGQSTAAVNLVLGAWGVFNLAATVMLLANRIPGRRLQVATIVLDLAVASGLGYLTRGHVKDISLTNYT